MAENEDGKFSQKEVDIAVSAYDLDKELAAKPPRCLNTGDTTDCGQAPKKYAVCDLCKRKCAI